MSKFNILAEVTLVVEGEIEAISREHAFAIARQGLEDFTPDMPFSVTSQSGYEINGVTKS